MSRSRAAARFYSRWATLYDYLARSTPGLSALRDETVTRMDLTLGMTVLDLGCGPGPNFASLRASVGRTGTVVGIDVAIGALRRATRLIAHFGWNNVHPIQADATDPPVESCDAVIASFVIGMFDDPASVVNHWCDVVGAGGRIGLLHFARSNRSYSRLPNALLWGLVMLSTPGKRQWNANAVLDRRIREAHATLESRCSLYKHTTHWGGILHIATGRVE